MVARSMSGINMGRACLVTLALLAGCKAERSASEPGPVANMGAPPAANMGAPPAAVEESPPPAAIEETDVAAGEVMDDGAKPAITPDSAGKVTSSRPARPQARPDEPAPAPTPPAAEPDARATAPAADLDPAPTAPAAEPDAPAPHASVEAFYASLPEQAIAFHVPRTAARGQMFTVRLVVQPGQSEADLAIALVAIVADAGPAPGPDEVRTRMTLIADEMQARISSPTLQIVVRGDDRQLVRRDAVTEWVWDVTAPAGGVHHLTLNLYAIPPGRGSGVRVKTFEETLTVEVAFLDDFKETIADHWEWMWTFVLGPIGAVAWRRRRRRHPPA